MKTETEHKIKFGFEYPGRPALVPARLIPGPKLDLSKKEDEAIFRDLKKRVGPGFFEACGDGRDELDVTEPEEIQIETKHLFFNQYNSAPPHNRRVFDAHYPIHYDNGRQIKRRSGYVLEKSQELIDVCNAVYKCGYCGANYYGHENEGAFCGSCIGGDYITPKNYPLLKLLPVSTRTTPFMECELRKSVTPEEAIILDELRITGQAAGAALKVKTYFDRSRQKVEADLREYMTTGLAHEKTKHDAKLWLLDHGERIDNVIYYKHTGRFCFGWSKPLTPEEKARLIGVLCEFPFDYDLKG